MNRILAAALALSLALLPGPALADGTRPVPYTSGQLHGSATNDSASAGNIGEYVEASVVGGSAVALTGGTPKTVTSISLTAGDWDVDGTVWYTGAASTTVTLMASAINTTTNALPTAGKTDSDRFVFANTTPFATQDIAQHVGTTRISISTTTTVYMVGDVNFGVSTCSAYGHIRARRVR